MNQMYVVIAIEPYRSVQNISLSFSLIKSFSAHINGKKGNSASSKWLHRNIMFSNHLDIYMVILVLVVYGVSAVYKVFILSLLSSISGRFYYRYYTVYTIHYTIYTSYRTQNTYIVSETQKKLISLQSWVQNIK